ncbi:hypothetical protein ElyMa_000018800 [Elysia marginata]|uniref:Uncharacterized protein n=1 Tax=Elysia marginata TaxID=1093978 RepID=A0AAV4EBN9_9GAST|nr:hypothetical protein ElyMa_000018800 [Elysia marginata]
MCTAETSSPANAACDPHVTRRRFSRDHERPWHVTFLLATLVNVVQPEIRGLEKLGFKHSIWLRIGLMNPFCFSRTRLNLTSQDSVIRARHVTWLFHDCHHQRSGVTPGQAVDIERRNISHSQAFAQVPALTASHSM